jgi:4-hydroxythreonine-4-phosphate dehydrogenase
LTAGEPAGIGPELICKVAELLPDTPMAIVADRDLLFSAAANLGLDPAIFTDVSIKIFHCPLHTPAVAGQLNPANSAYVLATLRHAGRLCMDHPGSAMITAPVHKGVINDSGTAFSGHTEFLAELSGTDEVVMMLATGSLRVALVTTHLPLRDVPGAITTAKVTATVRIVADELRRLFMIKNPRINVCGLNPHAGESGHLGEEEIEVIGPAIELCREEGIQVTGPLPADTAFTSQHLDDCDATIAMYHDQGLPVLKHAGFGKTVNITLGLPFVRTSVDHGTALAIAGNGQADPGSLLEAISLASLLSNK